MAYLCLNLAADVFSRARKNMLYATAFTYCWIENKMSFIERGAYRINIWTCFTDFNLPTVHSFSVPITTSKASLFTKAKKIRTFSKSPPVNLFTGGTIMFCSFRQNLSLNLNMFEDCQQRNNRGFFFDLGRNFLPPVNFLHMTGLTVLKLTAWSKITWHKHVHVV